MSGFGLSGARAAGAMALATGLALAGGAWAASGGHGDEAHHEPVPTGAALIERCEEYAEQMAFTREQLRRRNILGRSDFVKAEHRKRERFHEAYCSGESHARGGHDAGHDDGHGDGHDDGHDDGRGDGHDEGHDDGHDDGHGDGHGGNRHG